MTPSTAGYWIWGVWYVTWWLPVIFSAKTRARPPRGSLSNLDRAAVGVGALLLFVVTSGRNRVWPLDPLWREPDGVGWVLLGVIVAGFAFCWWARVHLGRLWSGLVTLKENHRVVDTGPYGLVRHPIYTGVMASAWALALIKASPVALAGAALVTLGFALTARKEERFLGDALGPGAYAGYRDRVPMLLPRPRVAPLSG